MINLKDLPSRSRPGVTGQAGKKVSIFGFGITGQAGAKKIINWERVEDAS